MFNIFRKTVIAVLAVLSLTVLSGTTPQAAAEILPTDPAYDIRYGENHRINVPYDASTAAKCINGTFVGKLNDGILEFKGIPFVAEQPVGIHRWKAPVPYKKDNGVYEAFYFGRHPLQNMAKSRDYVEGEDCLHLNVYTVPNNNATKKPVMVWIYGGAFLVGGTADPYYDGHNFVKDNSDVILVTINYRVGPYGFLHLSHLKGGEEYPDAQNLGLLDQRLALKWVKENIEAFGGDPDNITIFGESAGGASVMLHAIDKDAQKYFKRAISASGPLSFTNSTEQMKTFADKLMNDVGCQTVEDLQNADPRTLVLLYSQNSLAIFPERDGRIVPLNPYEEIENGAAKDIEIMTGCTERETYTFVSGFGGEATFALAFSPRVKNMLASCTPAQSQLVIDFMDKISGTPGHKLEGLTNQLFFFAPTKRMTDGQLNAGGKIWQYYWTAPSLQLHEPVAGHGADVPIVLNNAPSLGLEAERTPFDKAVQRMWVNFAACGNPSLVADDSPDGNMLLWEPYSPKDHFVLGIDREHFSYNDDIISKIVDNSLMGLLDYYMF